MTPSDPTRTPLQVGEAFDRLRVEYLVTGSIASSFSGTSRPAQDIDLVARIEMDHVEQLVLALSRDYYADRTMILTAIADRGSFHVIHQERRDKVDVFIPVDDLRRREGWARRRVEQPEPDDSSRSAPFSGPEDVMLRKLERYVAGGCVSDRQRREVPGILLVQSTRLEPDYLRGRARAFGLWSLLKGLTAEAGLQPPDAGTGDPPSS